MVEETSKDVYLAVNWAVRDAVRDTVYLAVSDVVNGIRSRAMSLVVSRAVRHAVRDIVDVAISDTMCWAVEEAVYDPKHPSLQEFLYSCGIEVGV